MNLEDDGRARGNPFCRPRRIDVGAFAGGIRREQHAVSASAVIGASRKERTAISGSRAVVNNRSIHLDAGEGALFVKDRRCVAGLRKFCIDALCSTRERFRRQHVRNHMMHDALVAGMNFHRLHPPVLFELHGKGRVDIRIRRMRFDGVLFRHRQHEVGLSNFPAFNGFR